jgi:hypothetical protein
VRTFAKEWRNRVIHSPVLPTWKAGSGSNPASAPPDVLGIADANQFKEHASDSIPLESLKKLVNHTVELAQKLHATCEQLLAAGARRP